ncbi:MAG: hypothetical protein JST00_09770 [Deltaproteobacteria bacterium]|nr:hypothetical protein [Deltaproteobacteria bacterium]
MTLPRALGFCSLVVSCLVLGCSTSGDAASTDDEDITDIPVGSIKDQSETGNCWLYATTAWIESLAANRETNRVKELSTSYLVYWNFYDQILESEKGFRGVEWTGGSWGRAVELVERYGVVTHYTMTQERAADTDAKLALEALATVNESLRRGALRSKSARRDPVRVRRELDRAFRVTPALSAAMTNAFGAGGERSFASGASVPPDGLILAPASIRVRVPEGPGRPLRDASLSEVIGTRSPGEDPDDRVGPLAWRTAPLEQSDDPSARPRVMRAFLKRIQRALHDGVPVPISWCVQDDGKDDRLRYSKAISGVLDSDCTHETLVVDYEARLPDGRVLKAGELATPDDMSRALADDVEITFLRVKNSWGLDDAPRSGYTDLYATYLNSQIRACPERNSASDECQDWRFLIDDVTLPSGY